MNRSLLHATALFALAASPAFAADTYTIDPVHSEVGFRVRHILSKTAGRFNKFEGTVVRDAAKPEASSVEFRIKADSIDTANEGRDQHLRSADFFDVEKNPEISFKSTKVEAAGKDAYKVTGNLTLRGVTKEIVLPVTWLGEVKGPKGNYRAGLETAITLNRKDYGLTWNRALETGSLVVGEEVEVNISLAADRAAAAAAPAAPPAAK